MRGSKQCRWRCWSALPGDKNEKLIKMLRNMHGTISTGYRVGCGPRPQRLQFVQLPHSLTPSLLSLSPAPLAFGKHCVQFMCCLWQDSPAFGSLCGIVRILCIRPTTAVTTTTITTAILTTTTLPSVTRTTTIRLTTTHSRCQLQKRFKMFAQSLIRLSNLHLFFLCNRFLAIRVTIFSVL